MTGFTWLKIGSGGGRAVASPGFNLAIPRKSGDSLATLVTHRFSKTVLMK